MDSRGVILRGKRRPWPRRAAFLAAAACLPSPADAKTPDPRPDIPPAVQERIDRLLTMHFHRCWSWPGPKTGDYVPTFEVRFGTVGRLAAAPRLFNAPIGPEQYKVAASAIEVIQRCGVLHLPARLMRYSRGWQHRILRFDTRDADDGEL